MIRTNSSTQCTRFSRILPLLAMVVSMAGPSLAMAADQAADVPTQDPGIYLHRFQYDPPEGTQPRVVAVGGEFNNWAQTELPMKPDGAGHFVADVKLAEGPHAYRFFVDGKWVNDSEQRSEADLEESNGIRGHNSAVVVGPDGRSLPKAQSGKITVEGLHHAPNSIRYFDPISSSELRIAFAAQAGNLTGAAVYSLAGQVWRRDELYLTDTRTGMHYITGVVVSGTPEHTYFFEVKSGATAGYYSGGKYYAQLADARRNAWQGRVQPVFNTPDWAQRAVWYQIFPERFRNGDKANDQANTAAWTSKWIPSGFGPGGGNQAPSAVPPATPGATPPPLLPPQPRRPGLPARAGELKGAAELPAPAIAITVAIFREFRRNCLICEVLV